MKSTYILTGVGIIAVTVLAVLLLTGNRSIPKRETNIKPKAEQSQGQGQSKATKVTGRINATIAE